MIPSRSKEISGVTVGPLTGKLQPTNDGFRNILSLLMVFTLSRIHQHYSFLTPLRPLMLLTLIAGLYALANPRFLATAVAVKTWSFKIIMAMLAMACLSVPFGLSMGNSGSFILAEYSKTVLCGVLMLFAIRNSNDLYRMIWAFTLAGGCLGYLANFVYKMHGTRGDAFVRIQSGYSYDSNDMALVAVLGLVIALLAFTTSGKRGKLVSLLVVVALGTTVAKSGSRGGFLALLVVLLALLFFLKGISVDKKLGFVTVVFAGLMFAAPPGYWKKMSSLTSPKEDYNWTSETGRKAVFKRGMGYMFSYPLTGVGIDNFGRAEGTLSARAHAVALDPNLPGVKWSVAHNSFVQAGAELGIPGMILFCTMVFGGLARCVKLRRQMPAEWLDGDQEQRFLYATALYLPIALLGFAIGGFFVSFAYLDPVYILTAFVGGLEISMTDRMQREVRTGEAAKTGKSVGHVAWTPRYRGGIPPGPPRQPALPPPVMHPQHP